MFFDPSLQGLNPQLRYLWNSQAKFNADDVTIVIDRADVTPAPTAAAWSYVVPFKMKTAAGEIIPFTGNVVAAAADTSSAGTASVDDTSPAVVMGVGEVTLSGDAAAWLDTETATATISFTTAYGKAINDVFTVTFTA